MVMFAFIIAVGLISVHLDPNNNKQLVCNVTAKYYYKISGVDIEIPKCTLTAFSHRPMCNKSVYFVLFVMVCESTPGVHTRMLWLYYSNVI